MTMLRYITVHQLHPLPSDANLPFLFCRYAVTTSPGRPPNETPRKTVWWLCPNTASPVTRIWSTAQDCVGLVVHRRRAEAARLSLHHQSRRRRASRLCQTRSMRSPTRQPNSTPVAMLFSFVFGWLDWLWSKRVNGANLGIRDWGRSLAREFGGSSFPFFSPICMWDDYTRWSRERFATRHKHGASRLLWWDAWVTILPEGCWCRVFLFSSLLVHFFLGYLRWHVVV